MALDAQYFNPSLQKRPLLEDTGSQGLGNRLLGLRGTELNLEEKKG